MRHHPKPALALAAHKHGLALALAARAMAAPAPLGDVTASRDAATNAMASETTEAAAVAVLGTTTVY